MDIFRAAGFQFAPYSVRVYNLYGAIADTVAPVSNITSVDAVSALNSAASTMCT